MTEAVSTNGHGDAHGSDLEVSPVTLRRANGSSGRWFVLASSTLATYAADIKSRLAKSPFASQPHTSRMKKYLPSLDEIVPGVIILLIGLAVWQIVSPSVSKLTAKLTPKA